MAEAMEKISECDSCETLSMLCKTNDDAVRDRDRDISRAASDHAESCSQPEIRLGFSTAFQIFAQQANTMIAENAFFLIRSSVLKTRGTNGSSFVYHYYVKDCLERGLLTRLVNSFRLLSEG